MQCVLSFRFGFANVLICSTFSFALVHCFSGCSSFGSILKYIGFLFNTIIYSRQMMATNGSNHCCCTKRKKRHTKESARNYYTERRHTRRMCARICDCTAHCTVWVRAEKQSPHPLLVWSQLLLIVVCDRSNYCALLLFAILSGQWHVCRRHLSIRVIFDVKHAFLDSISVFRCAGFLFVRLDFY